MNFGSTIKKERIANKYTIEELAAAVGCSKETLIRHEQNKYLPRMDTFLKLTMILDLDVNEMLNLRNYKEKRNKIVNITSTFQRRISGVITLEIIQNILKDKNILIIEDAMYNDVLDFYLEDTEQDTDLNEFYVGSKEIIDLDKYIIKSNDPNVDIILLGIPNSNVDLIYDGYDKRKIRNDLRQQLISFEKYDYIIINTIMRSKGYCEFFARVSDMLISINGEEGTTDCLDFLRDDIKNIKCIPLPKELSYIHPHIYLKTKELNKFLKLTVEELRDVV